MLRRLHHEQPESFAFTDANLAWAEAQITKYPEGRQASAVIPLLWRAQEQEGWLTKPALEHVADMLGMAYIRVLEVASFYFMFQMQPVGSIANIQICGTTTCMICGAEDLIAVCKEKIADKPHTLSADGKFTWEEVECLGACTNAPMAQIGKDYYEDLTTEKFAALLDELAAGNVPVPGPQNGRYSSEPLNGLTALTEYDSGRTQYNASVARATDLGDTVKRIDGTEVPLLTPWNDRADKGEGSTGDKAKKASAKTAKAEQDAIAKAAVEAAEKEATAKANAEAKAAKAEAKAAKDAEKATEKAAKAKPAKAASVDVADDLKQLKGVGPKLEGQLHDAGVTTFAEIAAWGSDDITRMDGLLSFKGRIERDGWVEQAKQLAAGGDTEFSKRVKKGDVYE